MSMQSLDEYLARFPLAKRRAKARSLAREADRSIVRQRVVNDQCPQCSGELDIGYECNDCGFDAIKLVRGVVIALLLLAMHLPAFGQTQLTPGKNYTAKVVPRHAGVVIPYQQLPIGSTFVWDDVSTPQKLTDFVSIWSPSTYYPGVNLVFTARSYLGNTSALPGMLTVTLKGSPLVGTVPIVLLSVVPTVVPTPFPTPGSTPTIPSVIVPDSLDITIVPQ